MSLHKVLCIELIVLIRQVHRQSIKRIFMLLV